MLRVSRAHQDLTASPLLLVMRPLVLHPLLVHPLVMRPAVPHPLVLHPAALQSSIAGIIEAYREDVLPVCPFQFVIR